MVAKLTPTKFNAEIEKIVTKSNGTVEYIDAVIHYCETNNVELDVAASLIKSNAKLKSVVQSEGEDLNMLPKTSQKLKFE